MYVGPGAEFHVVTRAPRAYSRSHSLENRRDAHSAADAQRDERDIAITALELVERGTEQHRAGRAERMPERDRSPVDVDALGIDVQLALGVERNGGEGLVDLPEIDVRHFHARFFERALRRGNRRG